MGNFNISASLEGDKELAETFRRFDNNFKSKKKDDMQDLFYEVAEVAYRIIYHHLPLGPTGNLREGLKAKKFDRKISYSPAAFVAIDRAKAPHAHLVEFGTRYMPAKYPFRKGVQAAQVPVKMAIKVKLKRLIEKWARAERIRNKI